MSTVRISQLVERSGAPASTLRFYETAGLLPAERTPSGYRQYGQDAVERLAFISSAKLLGLALEDIRDLLDVRDEGCPPAHGCERAAALRVGSGWVLRCGRG